MQTGNLFKLQGENLLPLPSQCKQVRGIQSRHGHVYKERDIYLGTYLPELPNPEEESPDFEPQPEEGLAAPDF